MLTHTTARGMGKNMAENKKNQPMFSAWMPIYGTRNLGAYDPLVLAPVEGTFLKIGKNVSFIFGCSCLAAQNYKIIIKELYLAHRSNSGRRGGVPPNPILYNILIWIFGYGYVYFELELQGPMAPLC